MSNPIVDSIIQELVTGSVEAAKQAGVDLKPQVVGNVKSFLGTSVPAITRWVTFTMSKALTTDDLKTLLEDLLEDALIHGLTILEKAGIEVDKTKNAMLQLVVGIVGTAVGKTIKL